MKKMFLLLVFITATAVSSFAVNISISNFTNCYFAVSTQSGTYFLTPTGSSGATAAGSAASITSAKVTFDATPTSPIPWTGLQINIGGTTNTNTSSTPFAPACHNNTAYTVYWSINPVTGDITLLIV